MNDKNVRTVRTVLQVVLAVAMAVPVLVTQLPIEWQQTPWLVTVVAIAAAVARFMQSNAVDGVLSKIGLGRAPKLPAPPAPPAP